MPETVAWWKKEARVWREAAEGHVAERDNLQSQLDALREAVAAHREVKLPGGIDLIDKRLYEQSRSILDLSKEEDGRG